MKKSFFIGVNITASELTEQLYIADKLPKNYKVQTTSEKHLNNLLENHNLEFYNIEGKTEKSQVKDENPSLILITKTHI